MTEQQEKLIRYDARQRGRELKAHIATLKIQMNKFSVAWRELGETFRDADINTFRIGDGEIRVLRPAPGGRLLPGQSPTMNEIATVPLSYFDTEAVAEMLSDLEQSKQDYAAVKKQCDDIGDPL